MSQPESLDRAQLESRFREVELEFEREMRARGFDPKQVEHLPLTASLAKLYTERERLRESLQRLTEGETTSEKQP